VEQIVSEVRTWAESHGAQLKYEWRPAGALSATMGDDGVLFFALRAPKPITVTPEDFERLKLFWTRFKGKDGDVPTIATTEKGPRVQSWDEALLSYLEQAKSAALAPVSAATSVLTAIAVFSVGLILWRLSKKK
jgi:hypothetical protein